MPQAADTPITLPTLAPACAFVWPPRDPPHWPAPAPQQLAELSRRRVFGLLAGGAAAGAALVIMGPMQTPAALPAPIDPSVCQTPFEVVMLSLFRQMDAKQQDAALTYLQDIAAGWNDTGWTRLNARPEGGINAVADDFVGLEKAAREWGEKTDIHTGRSTPETRHADAMIRDITQLQDTIAERVASARAYTPAGVRAKARMLEAHFRDGYPEWRPGISELLQSMIEDAAGVSGGAA